MLIVDKTAVPKRIQIDVQITSLLSYLSVAISLITITAKPKEAIDEKKLTNAAT